MNYKIALSSVKRNIKSEKCLLIFLIVNLCLQVLIMIDQRSSNLVILKALCQLIFTHLNLE